MKKLFAFSLLLLFGAGCSQAATPSTTAEENSGINVADVDVSGSGDLTVEPLAEGEDATDGGADDAAESEGVITEHVSADTDDVVAAPRIRELIVHASNFTFSVPTMSVKRGDTVRITFVNDEGFHDFKLDQFNVATKQIGAGASETVEFVANQSGTFEYYCSVGSHRAMGMKGTLTVE